MKIIDLLNRIAKGEEVPKKVWFDGRLYEYEEECNMSYRYKYRGSDCTLGLFGMIDNFNDEIEIIEEVEDKEYEDIEEITHLITPIPQELKGELGGVAAIYNSSIYEIKDSINTLIRNQKYILKQLNK